MKNLRTPDGRFASLPGCPFAPKYLAVDQGVTLARVTLDFIAQT